MIDNAILFLRKEKYIYFQINQYSWHKNLEEEDWLEVHLAFIFSAVTQKVSDSSFSPMQHNCFKGLFPHKIPKTL